MTQAAILAASGSPGTTTGFKNRLINGAMNIWQRGTSVTANSTVTWLADRWSGCQFANQTLSQSSSVPTGFQYSLKAQRPASGSGLGLINAAQTVEYQNMYDLAGQSVTFSFWALAGANFSASGSLLGVQLQTGTTADQGTAYPYYSWTGNSAPINTTQAITTTWTKYTFTGTIPSNAKELIVNFYYTPVGTAGADDAFYVTGLQLEVGTTATNFDFRSIGQETLLCQRYYIRYANGTGQRLGVGDRYATTFIQCMTFFPTEMRTAPTLVATTGSGYYVFYQAGTAHTFNSFTLDSGGTTTKIAVMYNSGDTSATAGQCGMYQTNNANGSIAFNAEL
jgi:hypothetical protein